MSEKMSTSNRTTKKGGKNSKTDTNVAKTKTESSSKTDPPKSSEKVQVIFVLLMSELYLHYENKMFKIQHNVTVPFLLRDHVNVCTCVIEV